jgi:uncharacterized protein
VDTKYSVTCDLFALPFDDGNLILYAPRLGFVSTVNNDVVNLLAELDTLDCETLNEGQRATLEYLTQKHVLNGSDEADIVKPFEDKYEPTMVTLFPTNQCNLRCRYCYASAGELAPLTMDWYYATHAIDKVIRNVREKGAGLVSLAFHGGGEPLFPWDFVKRTVEYAEEASEKAGLKLSVFSATNGLLSTSQLDWIMKHFVSLNVSFDGLPHVQDYQRPLPNGKGSFEFVHRTLKYLDEHNFNYGVRSTISSYNVDAMEESLDFIGKNYKTKMVHFEPLFYCGRCKTNDSFSPDMEKFIANFKKCDLKAKVYGVAFMYSGCRIESLTSTFCGATRDNFSVTPDGYVTTCYEVTSKNDPKSEIMFIGRINDNGDLEIDAGKRKFLHSLSVNNIEYCRDCFAKWHCGGECIAKLGHTDYSGPRGHDRCQLNRHLIMSRLVNLVKGDYYHPMMTATNKQENEAT